MKFKLAAGTQLYFGNQPVVLPYHTSVEFTKINSVDELAEILASKPAAYALNRDRLAHGSVTYGVGVAKDEGGE